MLSFVVIIVWFVLFPPPEPIQTEEQNIEQTQAQNLPAQDIQENVTLPSDLSDNKDVLASILRQTELSDRSH